MPRKGTADLPLHYGKVPRWLFQRMSLLAREVSLAIATEFGAQELLRRLSDSVWFQAFGCVLGFDWHSSGLTTTVCGALKVGLKDAQHDLGLYVAGGKGSTSRRTPQEIEAQGQHLSVDPAQLVYASRMSAKVDSSALQDGYQIYHHSFFFDRSGNWCVVQQGLNLDERYARRYHWLGEGLRDFVVEPHSAICCDHRGEVLNMVAQESGDARSASAVLAREMPGKLVAELQRLQELELPSRHQVWLADVEPKRLGRIFLSTYERQPQDFQTLLGMKGVGAKTIRALSLLSEIVYGAQVSTRDPARFTFAHGGKDGHPYPVDRDTYDRSIETLRSAIHQAKLGRRDRLEAFKRLSAWETEADDVRLAAAQGE
jgi:hypothetical protein